MRLMKAGIAVGTLVMVSILGYATTSPSPGPKGGRLFTEGSAEAAAAPRPQATETYMIDPVHSTIGFSVRHLVINYVPGRFKEFQGTIQYDPSDVTKSSVEFTAKVASIDTGVAPRDNHLRSPDFFDAAKYPDMTFKSTKVERKGKDAYVARGTFTLKGVSKEIAIPFKLYGPVTDPRKTVRLGVEASLTINRQDYGVSWSQKLDNGGLVVANDVNVQLNLEAVKK